MQDELIPVSNGQDYLEVHPTCLEQHQELGWIVCDRQEAKAPAKRKSAAADE